MLYDLHCHSTCSDGDLSPTALIEQAIQAGVDCLAITDHDSVEAHRQIQQHFQQQAKSLPTGFTLCSGVEFSCQWQNTTIHILGLNVAMEPLLAACEQQARARQLRAEKIAEKLTKLGIQNPLNGAQSFAGNAPIARPHFARFLIEQEYCKNMEQAFKKYLGAGKPGDVKQLWPSLATVTQWIQEASGIALLAHPHKYKFTRSKLLRLLDDFEDAGGHGLEVLSGRQEQSVTNKLADIARQRQLLCSLGSDFHSPKQSWIQLGMHKKLPEGCIPAWDKFN